MGDLARAIMPAASTDEENPGMLSSVTSGLGSAMGGVKHEISDMVYGKEIWGVDKLSSQLQSDVTISMLIFIVSNIIAACMDTYWRPILYDVTWSFLGVLVWALGFFMARRKNSFGIAGFVLLLTILACVNISHTMTMKDGHVRICKANQNSFEGCQSGDRAVSTLTECFKTNSCTKDQL